MLRNCEYVFQVHGISYSGLILHPLVQRQEQTNKQKPRYTLFVQMLSSHGDLHFILFTKITANFSIFAAQHRVMLPVKYIQAVKSEVSMVH